MDKHPPRKGFPFFTFPTIGPRFAIFRQKPSGLVKGVFCKTLRRKGLRHFISSDDLPENRRFGRKSVRIGQTTPWERRKVRLDLSIVKLRVRHTAQARQAAVANLKRLYTKARRDAKDEGPGSITPKTGLAPRG